MPSTTELVAELHSNIEPFRKGMREAVQVSGTSSAAILGSLQKIDRQFEALGKTVGRVQGIFTTFGRLAIGGGALAGITSLVRGTLERVTNIGKGADAIGVTTDRFQELTFAMSRAGVKTEEQNELLLAFGQSASEAASGQGKLFEALTKYNPKALEAIRSTSDVTQQLRIMANAVKSAAGEQERAALITAVFGKTNDDLRRFLIGGASSIDDAAVRARELGVVLDEDLVRKAPEVQEKFELLSNAIGLSFQNALVSSAPAIVEFASLLADLLTNVVIPAITAFNNLAAAIGSASEYGLTNAEKSAGALNRQLQQMYDNIDALQKEIESGGGLLDGIFGEGQLEKHERMMRIIGEAKKLQDEINRRGWRGSIEATPQFKPPDAPGGAGGSGSSAASDRALSELQRIHIEMLKVTGQTTEVIKAEHDKQLASLQGYLKEGLINVQQFEQARQELATISTVKLQEEAFKQFKPIADAVSGSLTRAFDEFVRTGKLSFKELARSMLADLAKVAFQMSVIQPLFGGAPGQPNTGGAFGSILAGVFHEGGTVGAGGATRAMPGLAFAMAPRFHSGGFPGLGPNEVPAILERGEQVIPKGRAGRGGGSPIVFNISTPDAESFRRSEGQITAMLSRAVGRGQRNL